MPDSPPVLRTTLPAICLTLILSVACGGGTPAAPPSSAPATGGGAAPSGQGAAPAAQSTTAAAPAAKPDGAAKPEAATKPTAAAAAKPEAAAKPSVPTPAPTCRDAKTTWKVAAEATRPNQTVTWADRFKELIEQRTNCQISLLIYQGGVLGTGKQTLEQVRLGTLDMTMLATDLPELYAPMGAVDLPFVFRDRAHAVAVLDGPIGKALGDGLIKERGIRNLSYGELGFRHVTTSARPIVKPDDLKGLKIRVPPNKLRSRTFEVLGAAAVPMAFSELYTALQQKVIDGQENPLSTANAGSFWEVQKFVSLTNHNYTPVFPVMNERIFQRLSPELQKQVLDTSQEVTVWHRQESEKADVELVKKLQEKGMAVNEVSVADFQRQVGVVWAEFAAPIGQELINSIANLQ